MLQLRQLWIDALIILWSYDARRKRRDIHLSVRDMALRSRKEFLRDAFRAHKVRIDALKLAREEASETKTWLHFFKEQ